MKAYDVLNILEKGNSTYIGMDCIEGSLLIDIIRGEEIYDIELFYTWCYSLCGELHGYHKARKTTFNVVTPYTVVIDERGRAHLLDLQAVTNDEVKNYLEQDAIYSRFVPENIRSNKNRYFADYYSFAKTIQFILSKVQFEPYFSKKQIKNLKRICMRCLDNNVKYHNIKELQREFNERTRDKKKPGKMVIALFLVVLCVSFYI